MRLFNIHFSVAFANGERRYGNLPVEADTFAEAEDKYKRILPDYGRIESIYSSNDEEIPF